MSAQHLAAAVTANRRLPHSASERRQRRRLLSQVDRRTPSGRLLPY
jgi:hypothetical protein